MLSTDRKFEEMERQKKQAEEQAVSKCSRAGVAVPGSEGQTVGDASANTSYAVPTCPVRRKT